MKYSFGIEKFGVSDFFIDVAEGEDGLNVFINQFLFKQYGSKLFETFTVIVEDEIGNRKAVTVEIKKTEVALESKVVEDPVVAIVEPTPVAEVPVETPIPETPAEPAVETPVVEESVEPVVEVTSKKS